MYVSDRRRHLEVIKINLLYNGYKGNDLNREMAHTEISLS